MELVITFTDLEPFTRVFAILSFFCQMGGTEGWGRGRPFLPRLARH